MIKLLIADDQALLRGGLRAILEAEDDLEVIAEAADGVEAVDETLRTHPDVVLMDIRMPRLDGLEATKRLLAAGSRARVLVITTFDRDEYVYRALRAGAAGFLLKSAPAERLTEAVRTVATGESLLDPVITTRLVEHFLARPDFDQHVRILPLDAFHLAGNRHGRAQVVEHPIAVVRLGGCRQAASEARRHQDATRRGESGHRGTILPPCYRFVTTGHDATVPPLEQASLALAVVLSGSIARSGHRA